MIVGNGLRLIVRTAKTQPEVEELHDRGGALPVEEAFELTSQLQISQQPNHETQQMMMNVGKLNIAHRIDGTLFAVPARISLHGTIIYNLNDLKEHDATTYKEYIKGAIAMADGWHKERAATESGLIVAPSLPPGGFRGVPVPGMKR
jgi:hypothetical protein